LSAFEQADKIKGKPTVIIAQTVKGKGISFAENNPAFHNGSMTPEQWEIAKADLLRLRGETV
jgi:transketolase